VNLNRKVIEKSNRRFLVKSKDLFLVKDYLLKMREALSDYQYCLCPDIESLIELSGSTSLFGAENRILVLPEIDKETLDVLVEIAERETEDVLIFVEATPLLKTKAYTKLKALCTPVDLKEPTESERAVWVRGWMTAAGLSFSDEIPSYVVNRSDSDLSRLSNEVKKIAVLLSSSGEKVVTKDLCDEVVVSNKESRFFVLMENFFRKKLPEVLEEFKKVDEYSYVRLLHFMIAQVEKAHKVAIYKEQGMSADQVGEILGVPAFIVKTKLFTVLSFYGKIKLLQLMDLLNKVDVELRTTKFNKSDVFEAYLLKATKL
jgi:DNA polymerase III delta subunit